MKNSTYKKLFDFYQNEQGVYTILTALISFVLLGIIALAVDGSGMLLDKARLSQGLEQGALALTTEANKPRVFHKDDLSKHKYFNSKSGSSADISGQNLSGKTINDIKAYQRDQELLKGYVQSYLPDANLPRDFQYDCQEQLTPKRVIGCWAQGDIDRPSWLPLNNTSLTFEKEEKIASEQVYVGKNLDDVAPLDLMLVTDLSGSMNNDEKGNEIKYYNQVSKISILRDVVKDISKELLDNPENRADISPYNRISFASFAFGASQRNNNSCYLPYSLNQTGEEKLFKKNIDLHTNSSYWWQWWKRSYRGRPLFEAWKWIAETSDKLDHNLRNIIYKEFLNALEDGIDYQRTVADIETFDGKSKIYKLIFNKNPWCLSGNTSETTSNKWYTHKGADELNKALSRLNPSGATLSSSGVLIGANLLMDRNTTPNAQPEALRINTQRILLVLSDGRDELYKSDSPEVKQKLVPEQLYITKKLIDNKMCEKIRSRLNSLQKTAYPQKNAQIHFVAFGYTASGEQKEAWLKCVGQSNYHEASNKQQLLDTFRQIVGLQEEVGHVAPHKVF